MATTLEMFGNNPLKANVITEDVFKAAMKEACILIGRSQPDLAQLALFYKKVKRLDARDFVTALNDDDLLKDWAFRKNLCWPSLLQAINKAQTDRLERENGALKKQEMIPYDLSPEIRAQIDAILGRKPKEDPHGHENSS
jgi:hypothetical protein